jgi:hypothetical protein
MCHGHYPNGRLVASQWPMRSTQIRMPGPFDERILKGNRSLPAPHRVVGRAVVLAMPTRHAGVQTEAADLACRLSADGRVATGPPWTWLACNGRDRQLALELDLVATCARAPSRD